MGLIGFEKMLFEALPVGVENRIPIKRLSVMFRKSEREIKGVISSLREQKIPVGTLRHGGGGVYIAKSKEELMPAITQLKNQAYKELELASLLSSIEFKEETK